MFLLVQVKDLVRLAPHEFGKSNVEAVRKQLDIKLSNKVIPDLGLCVLIKSIDSIGDCTVFPGDGGAHCEVLASIVVYRPFEGEVLQGRVHSSTRRGIRVSLEFFEDVLIPPYLMKPGTEYDPLLRQWVWKYKEDDDEDEDDDGGGGGGGGSDDGGGADGDGGDTSTSASKGTGEGEGEGEVQRFEIRSGELIHFRVHTIKFTKTSRSGKNGSVTAVTTEVEASELASTVEGAGGDDGMGADADGVAKPPLRRVRSRSSSFDLSDAKPTDQTIPPLEIVGDIIDYGLGLLKWWQ